MEEEEVFIQLPEFPKYEISNMGKLRHIKKKNILNPNPDISKGGYLRTNISDIDNKATTVRIHRLVAKTFIPNPDPINKDHVDHIDRNVLNNCASNLRWTTNSENQINSKISKVNKSGYKGISYIPRNKKFQVMMNINGKPTFLGYYKTIEEANIRWNEVMDEHYKEFKPVGIKNTENINP